MLDKRRPVHFPRSLTMLVMVKAVKQRHIANPNTNPSPVHFPRSLTMLVMVKAVKQRHIPNPNPNPRLWEMEITFKALRPSVRELETLGEIGGGPIAS